jgi:hypothetical protein
VTGRDVLPVALDPAIVIADAATTSGEPELQPRQPSESRHTPTRHTVLETEGLGDVLDELVLIGRTT